MTLKLKDILSKDVIQRLFYGFGLFFWTALFWQDLTAPRFRMPHPTIYGIDTHIIYLIPATILGLQILFNNKILWALTFVLFATQMLMGLFSAITHLSTVTPKTFEVLAYYLISGLVAWTIFYMKPKYSTTP